MLLGMRFYYLNSQVHSQVSCQSDIGMRMSFVETIDCNALKIENRKGNKTNLIHMHVTTN